MLIFVIEVMIMLTTTIMTKLRVEVATVVLMTGTVAVFVMLATWLIAFETTQA